MNTTTTEETTAAMDAGLQFGLHLLKQIPKGDPLVLEMHIQGVLMVFWGALWGTFGTELARGFIGRSCSAWSKESRTSDSQSRPCIKRKLMKIVFN